MNIKDLKSIQLSAGESYDSYKSALMVCTSTACVASRSLPLIDALKNELLNRGLDKKYLVVPTGCNGLCALGPNMIVQPEGVFYQKLTVEDLGEIIDKHLEGGEPVQRLLFKQNGSPVPKLENIPFYSKQKLLALRHRSTINPESIEDYIRVGGYQAIHKALTELTPESAVKAVTRSGLRGRGGGGFPTGVKWQSCVDASKKAMELPVVVCNADEGDPGAFMDGYIMESDPHAVIEGMMIGAYAIGSEEGFVYIRKEYPLALHRLEIALEEARNKGILGKNIFGMGFDFDITIHRGAGAFVCGESSALMASMSGLPGEPRAKYVRSVEKGYKDRPTVLNNVETWANIPLIIEKGAEWFASIGTGDVSQNPWGGSSGTKVFSLVGDINYTGLVEVPMGISLREIIYDIGGGIPGGKTFKGVQTGGPSGGVIPAEKLDLPIDFDSLRAEGSMMGSGGMVVMNENTCMVQIAKYFVDFLKGESCGKCTPCREGLLALGQILGRITEGNGKEGDIELLESYSSTMKDSCLCALGREAPNPVLSTIRYFRSEYEAHIHDHICPAGKCHALIKYTIIPEKCVGCTLCAQKCPVDAISGATKEVHVIDQNKCIKCGICQTVCSFGAVEVR